MFPVLAVLLYCLINRVALAHIYFCNVSQLGSPTHVVCASLLSPKPFSPPEKAYPSNFLLQVEAVANPLHQIRRGRRVGGGPKSDAPLGNDREQQKKNAGLLHSLLINSPQRGVRHSHMSCHKLFL